MSKAFEMISESLNEIIQDLKQTGGKNLERETLTLENEKSFHTRSDEKFFEQATNI